MCGKSDWSQQLHFTKHVRLYTSAPLGRTPLCRRERCRYATPSNISCETVRPTHRRASESLSFVQKESFAAVNRCASESFTVCHIARTIEDPLCDIERSRSFGAHKLAETNQRSEYDISDVLQSIVISDRLLEQSERRPIQEIDAVSLVRAS